MKQLRIHIFQHAPFEGPGYIESWIKENNHHLTITKFYEPFKIPDHAGFDWLVVMGGPMGVYDDQKFPWLKDEKNFIQEAAQSGKTVIGICLGAQLIASALGAKVYPNKTKEIGWFPLEKTPAGRANNLLKDLPDRFVTFHWHGDTFDLPKGADHLVKTDNCSNQAFVYNEKVIGLQFHLEVTPQALRNMIENCRHELVKDDHIQTESDILGEKRLCTSSNAYLAGVLNKLAGQNKTRTNREIK